MSMKWQHVDTTVSRLFHQYSLHVCVQVFEPAFREPFPNVTRWFLTCVNQPEFQAELGEVQLCSKAAQFDGTGGMGVEVGGKDI